MNIVFEADLSAYVAHRPSVLYWVMRPGAETGGIGMGLVRMVRPWHEWLLTWGYDIDAPPPEVDDAAATEIVRDLLGVADIPVRDHLDLAVDGQSQLRDRVLGRPGVLRRRRRAPASAVERPRLQHLHPGLLQPGLEAGHGVARPGRHGAAGQLHAPNARRSAIRSWTGPTSAATSSARSSRRWASRAAVTTRASPPAWPRCRAPDADGHAAARRAGGRDRAEELRIQRARCRVESALRLGCGARRRQPGGRMAARPPNCSTGRAPGPARNCRTPGWSTTTANGCPPWTWSVAARSPSSPESSGTVWVEAAEKCAAEFGIPLPVVRIGRRRRAGRLRRMAQGRRTRRGRRLLVRPDGYIAFRQRSVVDSAGALEKLRSALASVLARDEK